MPFYNKYQMNARETGAVDMIRTIHTAETQYYAQYGRFASHLSQLGPPAAGEAARTVPN